MTEAVIRVGLARVEGAQLARLADDLAELVGADRDVSDPAIERLAPDPYPDDVDASRSFRSTTQADLLDRRALDAQIVARALEHLRADPTELSDGEAVAPADIAIPASEVDSWLRTLTALRLIVAERLGVDSEDDHDPDDPGFAVYDWLGYRLEVLVQASDELL